MSTWNQHHHVTLAKHPQYAAGFRLLELGNAVQVLREDAGLTRAQLAHCLGVKVPDVVQVEEDTFDAPAGILESAIAVLLPMVSVRQAKPAADALRTVRSLRPSLLVTA